MMGVPDRSIAIGSTEGASAVSPWVWRLASASIVVALYAWVAFAASASIDGVRYFWLDDDQMISMRYARNLALGNGLVWNPGERVEGISNPGWTVVMAAVHALPIPDALTSLAVKLVNLALTLATLRLTERMLVALGTRAPLALPAALFAVALNIDVVGWGSNGFETSLLTTLFLTAVVGLFEDRGRDAPRASVFVVAGLMVIVRSDAFGFVATILALVVAGPWRLRRCVAGIAATALIVKSNFFIVVSSGCARMRRGNVSSERRFRNSWLCLATFVSERFDPGPKFHLR